MYLLQLLYFPPTGSVRRTHSSCISGWSSRLVSTSWKWRRVSWSTYLQVPKWRGQPALWLQHRVLLRRTSSSPCCWRSTAPSVKLHAPSAASCSPWSVDLLVNRATGHSCGIFCAGGFKTLFFNLTLLFYCGVSSGEWASPEIPGDMGAAQQAPFWESGVLWTNLAQQFTCTCCTAEVSHKLTFFKLSLSHSSLLLNH